MSELKQSNASAAPYSFEVVLFREVRDNENGERRADSGKVGGVLITQK